MLTPDSDALLQSDIIGWEKTVARTEPSLPRRARSGGIRSGAISAVTVLVFLVLWWIAANLALVSPVFLPGPAAVLQQAIAVTRDGYVEFHASATRRREPRPRARGACRGSDRSAFRWDSRWD